MSREDSLKDKKSPDEKLIREKLETIVSLFEEKNTPAIKAVFVSLRSFGLSDAEIISRISEIEKDQERMISIVRYLVEMVTEPKIPLLRVLKGEEAEKAMEKMREVARDILGRKEEKS